MYFTKMVLQLTSQIHNYGDNNRMTTLIFLASVMIEAVFDRVLVIFHLFFINFYELDIDSNHIFRVEL
jgi:hypothetical protein